jgi:hypothetical protein
VLQGYRPILLNLIWVRYNLILLIDTYSTLLWIWGSPVRAGEAVPFPQSIAMKPAPGPNGSVAYGWLQGRPDVLLQPVFKARKKRLRGPAAALRQFLIRS